jgi:hypothetical protein
MNRSTLKFERLDEMREGEEASFWTSFENALLHDVGTAAREHLAAGFPIYVQTVGTPVGFVEKRYPDGRVTFVTIDRDGERLISPLTYGPYSHRYT